MKSPLEKLNEQLGYTFRDISLLETALTHRSYGHINNERLEFLGDALLNFYIAEKLFQGYPDLTEGGLSRMRANLVNGDALAELARKLKINDYLRLGAGEQKSGGVQRSSILSNAMEAIIGAIYLDGGAAACQQCILNWLSNQIAAITTQGVQKDPKTQLQEFLQAKHLALPQYHVLSVDGREHNQVFKIECRVKGIPKNTIGKGSSRRRAEQDAAQKFLALFETEL
ncbi:MAG TPA: ribonuclease III [Gammaproteobacteria bacterium]|nr:ribonuclease III [Gammaproteobacteria bacterium]